MCESDGETRTCVSSLFIYPFSVKCCHRFLQATKDLEGDKLVRIKRNQVFYRAAPPPTGKRGTPRKDGERFQCYNAATHGPPDEQ